MRSWIHQSRGRVLRQAHVGLPVLGGLLEDMITRQGFRGAAVTFYRRNEPTAWSRFEGSHAPLDVDGSLLEPTDLEHPDGSPLRVFFNADVSIGVSRRSGAMTYSARNADADELHFVHEGTGSFYTEYGPIPYEPGDYVVIPRGVTYRVRPDGPVNYFLVVESTGELAFADIGPIGQFGPFDPALLFVPEPALDEVGDGRNAAGEWPVRIKLRGEFDTVFYDFDPIDVEGWKGDLFPYKLNIRDFRPISSERLHLMPSAHAVFTGPGFIVANFLPRPAEGDPEVERIPPFHRNVDYDEFLFSHGGTAFGEPVVPASMSHFPQGLHHGFSRAAAEASRTQWERHAYYDMKLIAIDTENPLTPTQAARDVKRAVEQIREARAGQ